MTSDPVHLSVVVPAYNEEKGIAEAIRRIEAYMTLKGWSWEILIVSDGSTDGTDRLVGGTSQRADSRVRLLRSDENHGKGFACRKGALEASGRFVLLTDADLSAPIKEVDKLIRALEDGCDVAIGSRAVHQEGCDVQQSFKRWLAGRLFNFFVRTLVVPDIRDTQCGFKCFKKEVARALFKTQKLDGFSFDVELLYLARTRGYVVRELPVMWRQGPDSRVRLWKDSFAMVRDLFRIKRIHGRGSFLK